MKTNRGLLLLCILYNNRVSKLQVFWNILVYPIYYYIIQFEELISVLVLRLIRAPENWTSRESCSAWVKVVYS